MRLYCNEIKKIEDDEGDWNTFVATFILSEIILVRAKFYQCENGKRIEILTRLDFFSFGISPQNTASAFEISCLIALEKYILQDCFNHKYKDELLDFVKSSMYSLPFDIWEEFDIEQLEYIIKEKKKKKEEEENDRNY